MKNLPIGIQTFASIINGNFTYVDKTGILHTLITKSGNRFFLSRPRRFGKSLTCSTFEAIFQGRKELFEGLAISKLNYDWKKHPVIRLDFSGVAHQTIEELKISLGVVLDEIAKRHGLAIPLNMLAQDKFRKIIIELAEKNNSSVVIIIDEYDKPILDHIHNKNMAEQMRDFFKSFYGILKGSDIDANLRFLFMTGVSKFSKVSIFSELNNLKDLTLDETVTTLCGYTQEELELVFAQHIKAFAQSKNITVDQMLAELKRWYNGFLFSKYGTKVYNPFSILNSLQDKDFRNYWFSSGTPTFIIKFIEKNPEKVEEIIKLEAERISIGQMEKLSVESYFQDMVLLFLQAGYLTIASFDEKSQIYQLSYPNYEVRLSMTDQILESVAKINPVKLAGFVVRFKDSLEMDNIEAFCQTMRDFFTILPLTVIIDREKFYQGVFFTVTKLIGAKIDAEQATSRGYIDAVLEGKHNTYVIEFKKDKSPAAALKQIKDKEYFAKFKIEGNKPVILVGMNFKYDKKGVKVNWEIETS